MTTCEKAGFAGEEVSLLVEDVDFITSESGRFLAGGGDSSLCSE